MIHAFVDCDVIIDLLTHREPHFTDSALIFQRALEKNFGIVRPWEKISSSGSSGIDY